MSQKLAEVIDEILSGNNYDFGEIWHGKEKTAAVVPILLKHWEPLERGYVLAEEVLDKLDVTDTGSIDQLELKTKAGKPVFMRSGMLFKGQGTQSRAVQESGIIQRGRGSHKVRARCVYASHGIRAGARFRASTRRAPVSITRALRSGSQGRTWGSVDAFAAGISLSAGTSANLNSISSDDLIGSLEETGYSESIDKFIAEIPAFENQVGIAVLDSGGVVGVELFDHPDSWKAVSKSVLETYGEVFKKTDKKTVFKIQVDSDAARKAIDGFLRIVKSAIPSGSEKEDGTNALEGKDVTGEFTRFTGRVIHLLALRKEENDSQSPRPRRMQRQEEDEGFDDTIGELRAGDSGRIRTALSSSMPSPPIGRLWTRRTPPAPYRQKRKVLLTMDEETLASVDTYAVKEHKGNRSKAIGKLASNGLKEKGYSD